MLGPIEPMHKSKRGKLLVRSGSEATTAASASASEEEEEEEEVAEEEEEEEEEVAEEEEEKEGQEQEKKEKRIRRRWREEKLSGLFLHPFFNLWLASSAASDLRVDAQV